jgi:hypothetical protein
VGNQRTRKCLPIVDSKAKAEKKRRFASPFRVINRKKIIDDLGPIYSRQFPLAFSREFRPS